jgi:hypothetical protein
MGFFMQFQPYAAKLHRIIDPATVVLEINLGYCIKIPVICDLTCVGVPRDSDEYSCAMRTLEQAFSEHETLKIRTEEMNEKGHYPVWIEGVNQAMLKDYGRVTHLGSRMPKKLVRKMETENRRFA